MLWVGEERENVLMGFRAVIGLVTDFCEIPEKRTGQFLLREHYVSAILKAGATPILLPYAERCMDNYLSLCHGVVFTGGGFSLDPSLWGEPHTGSLALNPKRSAFELAFFAQVFAARIPILGICAGMQLINVASGGSLIQDLAQCPGVLSHVEEPSLAAHKITISPQTRLGGLLHDHCFKVNTSHRQAIAKLGQNVVVNAVAEDGIIEGIECGPEHPFCVGVQWHPEYYVSRDADEALFRAFVEAAFVHQRGLCQEDHYVRAIG